MRLIAGLLLALSLAATARAEVYRLNLTRVGDNIYRESSTTLLVVTRNCHASLHMEDVILNYEPHSPYNMIVLNRNGDYCEVKELRDAVS